MGIQGVQSIYKKPFVYSLTPRIGASSSAYLTPNDLTASGTAGTYKGTFYLGVSLSGVFYLYFAYPAIFTGNTSFSDPRGYDAWDLAKTNSVSWVGIGTRYSVTISGRVIPFVLFRTQATSNTTTNTWQWSWTAS